LARLAIVYYPCIGWFFSYCVALCELLKYKYRISNNVPDLVVDRKKGRIRSAKLFKSCNFPPRERSAGDFLIHNFVKMCVAKMRAMLHGIIVFQHFLLGGRLI